MSTRTRWRRGVDEIRKAAGVRDSYAIANCGWGFDVVRRGVSIGWVAIGDTPLLPPEHREPGFTVYRDSQSSDALARSDDLAGALGHIVPKAAAAWLARGIGGRDIFEVAMSTIELSDDLGEEDWRAFWMYDPYRLTLTGTRGLYEIALEPLTTAARMLDTIFQVQNKPWCDPTMAGMLLAALEELLAPQALVCSFGVERGPVDVRQIIGSTPPIT